MNSTLIVESGAQGVMNIEPICAWKTDVSRPDSYEWPSEKSDWELEFYLSWYQALSHILSAENCGPIDHLNEVTLCPHVWSNPANQKWQNQSYTGSLFAINTTHQYTKSWLRPETFDPYQPYPSTHSVAVFLRNSITRITIDFAQLWKLVH